MTVRAFVTLATLGMLCVPRGEARADEPVAEPPGAPVEEAPVPPPPPDDVMRRIRELHEQRDFIGVRRELLAVYAQTPHPSLLFALGQAEFNLAHYEAAIAYYGRFLATGPEPEYVALAQQAVGAARGRLALPDVQPPPPPPPPRRHREWRTRDSGLVALGGAMAIAGAGLIGYGRHLGNDRSGSLADYDARTDRATTVQWTGTGIGVVGVLVVGITLVRWRLQPEDGDGDGDRAREAGTQITVSPTTRGASLLVSRRW